MKRLLFLLLLMLTMGACASNDSNYPGNIAQQGQELNTAIGGLKSVADNAGIWGPGSAQASGPWGTYQYPAIAESILANVPQNYNSSRGTNATDAIDTLDYNLADHPQVNFEPSTDTNAVDGTWFGEVLGVSANVLRNGGWLSQARLQRYESRLVAYVDWLESSHNALYYINGNVNLRYALIMLAADKLALGLGDRAAYQRMSADYQQERQFVTDPCTGFKPATWGCKPWPGLGSPAWGWNSTANGGYFSETPGNYPGNWWCANGTPCTGFDPEYTTLQLQDALTGYVLSGYASWWQNIVTAEYGQLSPLISNGQISYANGSRHNSAPGYFYPPVYSVFDEHNIAADDAAWQTQLALYKDDSAYWDSHISAQGPSEYEWISDLAIGILDVQQTK